MSKSTAKAGETATPEEAVKEKKSTAQRIVEIVDGWELYRLGVTATGHAFAVELDGSSVILPITGTPNGGFGQRLARDFYKQFRRPPNAGALSDAQRVLMGRALDLRPEDVFLRTGRAPDGSIALDLGDETGRAIVVGPEGWALVDRSPVLFRRTSLTAAWPVPERGGDISHLAPFIKTDAASFDLLVAVLVGSMIPDIPHPVVTLLGEPGSVKSSATKFLARLMDPTNAPLRDKPKDPETWVTAAAGSWSVAFDNMSSIPDWLSDALCRAVTGEGSVRRKLYTDGDLYVDSFRRVILINGVDIAGIRGDLADRMITADCAPVTNRERRGEQDVIQEFESLLPKLLGAILDLLVGVLAAQRDKAVKLEELPRLADFARVVHAVDLVRETDALATFGESQKNAAVAAAEEDVLATPLATVVAASNGRWTGTAAQLLEQLERAVVVDKTNRAWPRNARVLSQRLQLMSGGLRQGGWEIKKRKSGNKLWEIRSPSGVSRGRRG